MRKIDKGEPLPSFSDFVRKYHPEPPGKGLLLLHDLLKLPGEIIAHMDALGLYEILSTLSVSDGQSVIAVFFEKFIIDA